MSQTKQHVSDHVGIFFFFFKMTSQTRIDQEVFRKCYFFFFFLITATLLHDESLEGSILIAFSEQSEAACASNKKMTFTDL